MTDVVVDLKGSSDEPKLITFQEVRRVIIIDLVGAGNDPKVLIQFQFGIRHPRHQPRGVQQGAAGERTLR